MDILGFGSQLTGAAAGAAGTAGTALAAVGLVYPKKYEVTKMTTGIKSKPHETNSISLTDKYTIKNVTMRPEKMCAFIFSGVL